jgi:AcrR family transcriptional regulator
MGLREEKKEHIRSNIAQVALTLFNQQGFEQTTFAQIAQKAGLSIRTCTRYFPNKVDLAFSSHHERLERFSNTMESYFNADNPFEGISSAFRELVKFYVKRSQDFFAEWKLVSSSSALSLRDIELDNEYEQIVAEVLMRGRLTEAECNIIAGTIFFSVRASMNQWFVEQCRRNLIDVGQLTFSMLDWLGDAYQGERSLFSKARIPTKLKTRTRTQQGLI